MSEYTLMKFNAMINGDLRQLMAKSVEKKKRISLQTKLYLIKKLYEACRHLWLKEGKAHNDIKLDNVLISDCLTKLILCDFGHTTLLDLAHSLKLGTKEYRAPELNDLPD